MSMCLKASGLTCEITGTRKNGMITFNTGETGLHMNRLPVLLVFIFICISCAAPAVGPQFKVHESIPKESALIYVYRPEKLGVTVCINIYIDKKLIGCLGS